MVLSKSDKRCEQCRVRHKKRAACFATPAYAKAERLRRGILEYLGDKPDADPTMTPPEQRTRKAKASPQ